MVEFQRYNILKGTAVETVKKLMIGILWIERGMNMWSTGRFEDGKAILYDTVVLDTCHHASVKIYGMYNIKSMS